MAEIKILNDGPLLVQGEVKLIDSNGNEVQIPKSPYALCRCGGSTTKPFCDGTHSKIGFRGAEEAVKKSDE